MLKKILFLFWYCQKDVIWLFTKNGQKTHCLLNLKLLTWPQHQKLLFSETNYFLFSNPDRNMLILAQNSFWYIFDTVIYLHFLYFTRKKVMLLCKNINFDLQSNPFYFSKKRLQQQPITTLEVFFIAS